VGETYRIRDGDRLVSVAEFMRLTSLSRAMFYKLRSAGRLRGVVKLGNEVRVSMSEIQRYLAAEVRPVALTTVSA
jgi:predicted DNA-binding transcriptional regulator AlpA